ncbi:MAG: hypothetical protein Q8O15_06485 [Rectinemataceae bacterium]|nr:hypothetical protein [Rectinemataceae bacterium]
MENRGSFHTNTKALLALASICAFLAIFATIDTSEHYKAWKTARLWTQEQKSVAPATDADSMRDIILGALAIDTAIIALSFACGLSLGISVATDSAASFSTAKWLGWTAIGLGLLYSAIMVIYQFKVGPRIILKGPVFDYDLSMQLPIALAVGGFPLSFAGYLLYCRKK